jgi:hypothetical protein
MMSKHGKRKSGGEDWLEVADEPNHKGIFENDQIRAYVAVIRPGQETSYHRHDQDTLYLVLEGGKNYSTTLPGSKSSKYVFPKSISLLRKIKWGLTLLIHGWTYLPKSIYFLMYNNGNPVIHKVRASEDNECAMELMGIEFLNPAGGQRSLSIGLKSLKTDYEDDTICVFRVKFPSDLSHIQEPLCFVGIVIVLKGAMRIEASSPGDSACVNHDLKEGNLLWNDGGAQFAFSMLERSESEALVILMR